MSRPRAARQRVNATLPEGCGVLGEARLEVVRATGGCGAVARAVLFVGAALAVALATSAARAQPSTGVAGAPTGELVTRTELRVCADPGDLPFSDQKEEGFENKIATLLGSELQLPVRYVWFPQVVGFVRNTLDAGRCDLVLGTVAGDELMQTTTPYYHTSYVAVFRAGSGLSFADLDSPRLKGLHIGIVSGTPPSDLLVRHGLMANARPYELTVDTRLEQPARQLVLDVASGKTDAGFVWGPIAGYYIRRDKLPLEMAILKSEPGSPRMDYHIAMGLRRGEPEWRQRVNAAIMKRQGEITGILKSYGVPLLDEEGRPLPP